MHKPNQPAIDLTGKAFGRLTVVSYQGGKRHLWLCQCVCGTAKIIPGRLLRDGSSRSCSCFRSEFMRSRQLRHGESGGQAEKSAEYSAWAKMIDRCDNPRHASYAYYGGIGIQIHPTLRSYECFLAEVGRKPSLKHSLERIRNEDGYVPGNLRWATAAEQARNKRNNVWVICDGEPTILTDAITKRSGNVSRYRYLRKRGLEPQAAFNSL